MKQRSVISRNLLGAFMGGAPGVLSYGYVGAIVVVPVVTVGVICGWWYQEIWDHVIGGVTAGVTQARHFCTFVFVPARRLKEIRFDAGPVLKVFGCICFPIIWVTRMLGAFFVGLKHPMGRAYVARALALLVYYAANTAWIWLLGSPLVRTAGRLSRENEIAGMLPLMGCLLLFITCILLLMLPLGFVIDDQDSYRQQMRRLKRFYRDLDYYVSQGALAFFRRELKRIFAAEIFAISLVFGTIAWYLGVGSLYMVIVGVMSALIGLIKGVYSVSIRAGHRLCLCSTLAVTFTVICLWHGYFGDPRVLWLAALATGIVAAGVTEVLRRWTAWAFNHYRAARAVALVSLERQLRPSGRLFLRVTNAAGVRLTSLFPEDWQTV